MSIPLSKAGRILAILGVMACADIVSPTRTDFYDWRLVVGVDSLSFSWPQGQTVRIWVEDTLNMPAHTQTGINSWKAQFLYGEYDATLVTDSSIADVLVGVSIPPAAVQAYRLASSAPECAGVTTFPPLRPDRSIILPFVVQIMPRTIDPTSAAANTCYELTVTHELGHTMGLFVHSDTVIDLMFTDPVVGAPSTRDRNTIQQLYHFPPDLTARR